MQKAFCPNAWTVIRPADSRWQRDTIFLTSCYVLFLAQYDASPISKHFIFTPDRIESD